MWETLLAEVCHSGGESHVRPCNVTHTRSRTGTPSAASNRHYSLEEEFRTLSDDPSLTSGALPHECPICWARQTLLATLSVKVSLKMLQLLWVMLIPKYGVFLYLYKQTDKGSTVAVVNKVRKKCACPFMVLYYWCFIFLRRVLCYKVITLLKHVIIYNTDDDWSIYLTKCTLSL